MSILMKTQLQKKRITRKQKKHKNKLMRLDNDILKWLLKKSKVHPQEKRKKKVL